MGVGTGSRRFRGGGLLGNDRRLFRGCRGTTNVTVAATRRPGGGSPLPPLGDALVEGAGLVVFAVPLAADPDVVALRGVVAVPVPFTGFAAVPAGRVAGLMPGTVVKAGHSIRSRRTSPRLAPAVPVT